MALDAQMKWLIFEGVLPIFGAGVLYSLWGLLIAIARGSWKPAFAWREAVDPLGWLYGALIIAIQAAVRSLAVRPTGSPVTWACMIGAGFCFMLLLAAMSARGQHANWQPRLPLKLFAGVVVIGTLACGYFAQPGTPAKANLDVEIRNGIPQSRRE
jgi:hypothetical protein